MLSAQGEQRREEILKLALEESRRVQRRRQHRRRIVHVAAGILLMAVLVSGWLPRPAGRQAVDQPLAVDARDQNVRLSSSGNFELERHLVRSEVDRLDRYLVRTHEQLPADVLLDDKQLLGALAELGRVEGIVRVDGQSWLTSELDSRTEAWK